MKFTQSDAGSLASPSPRYRRSTLAQAPVEISFYYPIAVGGPITKFVDGLAADFEKENPGIKVKPIYSGKLSGHRSPRR